MESKEKLSLRNCTLIALNVAGLGRSPQASISLLLTSPSSVRIINTHLIKYLVHMPDATQGAGVTANIKIALPSGSTHTKMTTLKQQVF